jgi:hypothetical protein
MLTPVLVKANQQLYRLRKLSVLLSDIGVMTLRNAKSPEVYSPETKLGETILLLVEEERR